MKAERLAQIEELFHRAVECEPEERLRLLGEARGADPELRREVETCFRVTKAPALICETLWAATRQR